MGLLDGILKGYTDAVLGPAPTDVGGAYQKLQESINTRYDTDKQKFEADPANSGKSYQLPDPLTRWYDQIQGMITSGDPVLQKEGLSQLSQYQQRATAATTNEAPASVKEFQYAQANGFGGSYTDWKQLNSKGNNISVNVNSGEKWVPLDQLAKFTMPDGSPIPPGTTMGQLQGMGAIPVQTDTQRIAGTSGDVLDTATKGLGENIEAASDSPTSGIIAEIRSQPGLVGQAVDVGLNLAGRTRKEDEVKFSNFKTSVKQQTVKLMSGASATEGEMETYSSMLPKLSDPVPVRNWKFKQADDFAKSVIARNQAAGVTPRKMKANVSVNTDKSLNKATAKEPAWQQTQSGVKYRIVE